MSTLSRRSKRRPLRKKCSKYHAKATWTVLRDWSFAMGALQLLQLCPWSRVDNSALFDL